MTILTVVLIARLDCATSYVGGSIPAFRYPGGRHGTVATVKVAETGRARLAGAYRLAGSTDAEGIFGALPTTSAASIISTLLAVAVVETACPLKANLAGGAAAVLRTGTAVLSSVAGAVAAEFEGSHQAKSQNIGTSIW